MPSKYMVSVSLDEVTMIMWEELPVGTRSKRIREAISTASIVNERDMLVAALRKQIDHAKRTISDMRLYCTCRATKGVKE